MPLETSGTMKFTWPNGLNRTVVISSRERRRTHPEDAFHRSRGPIGHLQLCACKRAKQKTFSSFNQAA